MGRRKTRKKFVPFVTSLTFATGEHKDASLVERYRLDVGQLRAVPGLLALLSQWVKANLVGGKGIRYRDHSLRYRLERYSQQHAIWRNGQWHQVDRLVDDDLACIKNITAWFRGVPDNAYAVVEAGFNEQIQICKIAINVQLPTGNTLFMALGVDRGLKTFYCNDRPKEAGATGFHCAVAGCDYTTARQLFLVP